MIDLAGNSYVFVLFTVVVSFIAFPVSYILNIFLTFFEISSTVITFYYLILGSSILAFLYFFGLKITAYKIGNGKSDWMVTGMFVFGFTCVIDFIDWLEFIGAIKGFMTLYLKHCEPYLFSSWGAAISLFDIIGFFPMYLWMIFQLRNKNSNWTLMAFYWCGGLLNSMFVEIVGALAASAKFPFTVAIFLNVPYFVLPMAVFFKICKQLLQDSDTKTGTMPNSTENWNCPRSLRFKLTDFILTIGLAASMYIHLVKGLCALGSDYYLFEGVISPERFLYLENPAPFGKVQALILFAFIVPIQCFCIKFTATGKNHKYLRDASLFYAGVMIHSQFCYMYASLDKLSHPDFITDLGNFQFWFVNLFIAIVPHMLLVRNKVIEDQETKFNRNRLQEDILSVTIVGS